jgi:hypothetical protein
MAGGLLGLLNLGLNPNQTFNTSSLMGPASLDQSLMAYLQGQLNAPANFSQPNNMFSTLMQPGLFMGPNGVALDPKQTQANASEDWLGGRANVANQNQQNNLSNQGAFGSLLNNYSGILNNIQSLNNQANTPTLGVGGLFGSLLGF